MIELLNLSLLAWLTIVVAAFLTGVLHGATGMAGGVVMVLVLGYIIDIKAGIAAMTCALIISHSSRVFFYAGDINRQLVLRVLLFAAPTIVLGSWLFTYLDARIIALVFAVFLTLSFPIKYWAKHYKLKTSPQLLSAVSVVWGMLAGNVVGPGFFLAPFLLGTGINRLTFVGSLAAITLGMNLIKLSVFGVAELMSWPLLALGVLMGVCSIPGNWLGRKLLILMGDRDHRLIIDVLTVAMIGNFVWLAVKG
jgi:uncharacterized membrane protein YfcA